MKSKKRNNELFNHVGFKGEPVVKNKTGFFTKIGNFFKNITGLIALTLITILVFSLLPLMTLSGLVSLAEPAFDVWKKLPTELPEIAIAERNTIYDKNGAIIAETWVEDRVELESLDEISPYAIQGLIDTEDKRFYSHNGFDLIGTGRAFISGSGGGSGITQQLIKNLQFYNLLGKENKNDAVEATISRKIKELRLSLSYNEKHTKDEILLQYFNTVAFGGPNIYGIETASKYFFGKSAKDLTIAEAAALVGSVNNPIKNNMDKPDNKEWKSRQRIVINRLLDENHITKEEADAALKEELNFVRKHNTAGSCNKSDYPFYCKYVMSELYKNSRIGDSQKEREAIIAKGGLQIYTHMDPEKMDLIDSYMEKNWGNKNRMIAPTVILEPGTGAVIAFGANRDWGNGEGQTEINLPESPSSEGSIYKMFTLAAALNSGMSESDLTFGSLGCPLRPGKKYDSPPNGFKNSVSCEKQGGVLNYKQATAYSSNTWFVTLEMKIGVDKIKEFSKNVGLATPDYITNRSLSYTLGTVENSPINGAAAFATFSNKGVYCPPTPFKDIIYKDGTAPVMPDSYNPEEHACRAVISPKDAGVVLKAMKSNVSGEIPDAFGVKSGVPGYDTAAKSGTNGNLNSTWVHLSSPYVVYTNVYDKDKPTRGIDGARFKGKRHMWYNNTAQETGSDIMKQVLKGTKNVPLDTNNKDDSFKELVVDESDFFVVPSVIGMSPENALDIMSNIGLKANVSKDLKPVPDLAYHSGTIVEQSIPPGTRLAKGTSKEIILFEGKE